MEIIFTMDDIKHCLFPVFKQYGVKRAVLFGSYGKGLATKNSDVDLLVDSGLKGLKFFGLLEDVRTALGGKDVDLFDITHIEKGSLVEQEIQNTGVLVYEE